MENINEKCSHNKTGMCVKCVLDRERNLIIKKAQELSDTDSFADRVLRYLELAKKLDNQHTETHTKKGGE